MAATAAPSQVRPRREREEELLVWPDLVFVEFICAVLFTFSFTVISALVNAPLINRANPDETPNPSKAPWYFLNLQELLLHMHPALAGVVVPTVALILLDSGKHAEAYEKITGTAWPAYKNRPDWLPDIGIITAIWDLIFSRNFRAIQTEWTWNINLFGLDPGFGPNGRNGRLDWPDDFTRIPLPIINGTWWPKWGNDHGQPPPQWYQDLPDWLTGLYPYDLNVNLPAFIVELLIPTLLMIGLPILLIYLLWRVGWIRTRRDVMISIFSGFIVVYWVMTIVGAAFRGAGQDLVMPWDVPRID